MSLVDNLFCSCYDGLSGLGDHIKGLYDMANDLRALGVNVSNDFVVNCIVSSMPKNHTRHAQNDKVPTVYRFCNLPY